MYNKWSRTCYVGGQPPSLVRLGRKTHSSTLLTVGNPYQPTLSLGCNEGDKDNGWFGKVQLSTTA